MSPPGGSAGPVLTISTEILVASVIFLFVTVVFVVFLYLYVKHNWGARLRRRHLFVFEADPAAAHADTRRGLDPAILSALPVTIYRSSSDTDKDSSSSRLECAVCLCHVSDGEKARLLPRCRHGFHVECIDMWFHSHSTCPLCRSPVQHAVHPSAVESSEVVQQGASSSGLVIEIPRRQQQQQQQQQGILEDDDKSPASAASLRSLKGRLWSRGKREDHVSVDVEQGFATSASASAGGGGGGGRGSAPTPPTPNSAS